MNRGQLWAVSALAAIALAAPVGAQAPETVPAPEATPAPAPSSPVDAFYAAHLGAPIWFRDEATRAAATKLPEILRGAMLDDFDGTAAAATVEAAIARGQPGDEIIISSAWARFVQALKAPVTGVSYGDPALALKPPSADAILSQAANASSLIDHVDRVAAVNPLYAALHDEAAKAGGPIDPRVRATLDRLRLLPASGRAIMVDVASAQLMMIEDGKVVDSMKVIVGKKSGATPIVASTVYYVTFNPYWHIPQDIARVRVAPVVLKRGVGYLTLAKYQTVAGFGGDKETPIDPISVDWKAVANGTAEVHVRQLAGPQNMMGRLKIGFVNDYGVFLHDTPKKELFAKDMRFLSHGCIRLEQPERLASWLLGHEATAPNDDSELQVLLDKGVPIFLTYLTARPGDDGTIAFANDVYGLDTPGAEKAIMASAGNAH